MKYICLSALLAVVVIMTVSSCSKPTTQPNMQAMLRTGKWRLSSGTLSLKLPNGKDTSLDYVNAIVPKCHQDDYLRFYDGLNGAVYANSTKCSPADPDSISFAWTLSNNNTFLSFYSSQNFYYSVTEGIMPYHFDTLSQSPLVLDSNFYAGGPAEIDSIYNLTFTEVPAYPTPPSTNLVDIDNAVISNFSQKSFILTFSTYGSYPDSTHFNQMTPITRADTFHYSLTYTNY